MISLLNNIDYKINDPLEEAAIIEVFRSSGIIRPIQDIERIKTMFQNSNLVVSAWVSNELIGISRALTDFAYCCYLSDLAVKKEYQHGGIGKRLVEITKETIGDKVTLILLSAPEAMDYYPKIGLEKVENGFIIKRKF
jgi:ribosomal protein S18 acetylase RimI-like enzyme